MTFGSSEHQNRVGITWSKVGGKVYHLTYSQSIILKGSMLQQLCYPSPSTECLRLLVEGSRTDDTEGSRSVSLEFSVPVDIWSYEHLRGWSRQFCNIWGNEADSFATSEGMKLTGLQHLLWETENFWVCPKCYDDDSLYQYRYLWRGISWCTQCTVQHSTQDWLKYCLGSLCSFPCPVDVSLSADSNHTDGSYKTSFGYIPRPVNYVNACKLWTLNKKSRKQIKGTGM